MIRQPAVAGAFYPRDAENLKRLIESCFLDESGVGFIPEINDFEGADYPINVMVPHAGYQYSGPIASHGYCQIVQNGFACDFSWIKSAKDYIELYKKL